MSTQVVMVRIQVKRQQRRQLETVVVLTVRDSYHLLPIRVEYSIIREIPDIQLRVPVTLLILEKPQAKAL